jgi:hypothetical protein
MMVAVWMTRAARLVLFILLCLWATGAYAQSALDVRVSDQQGRALPNAILTLKQGDSEKRGATDAKGSFRFLGISAVDFVFW